MHVGVDITIPRLQRDVYETLATVYDFSRVNIPEKTRTQDLHRRVIHETIGRPLWKYTSDVEPILALRAAVRGMLLLHTGTTYFLTFIPHLAHRSLQAQGILHHDISASTVILKSLL